MSTADFVTMTCPSCNSRLEISKDIEHFACGSCGNEYIVNRTGGVVGLSRSVKSVQRVQAGGGENKIVSELAIARLTKEIEQLSKEYRELDAEDDTSLYLYGGIGIFISWVAFANDGAIMGFVIGIPSVLMIVGAITGGSSRSNKKQELGKAIGQKKSEIARHKEFLGI